MTLLRYREGPSDEPDEIASLATLWGDPADLDSLLEHIGDARFVLLVAASHGTAQCYYWRAVITCLVATSRKHEVVDPLRAEGRLQLG